MQAFAVELHDNEAAAFGIEKRYPFWDKRLVEFCLTLPSDQKLNDGWTRVVMRRAMNGILPPQVQWRSGKMDFVPSLAYGLRVFERDHLDEVIIRNPGVIEEYVNIRSLRQAYSRFLEQDSDLESKDLFAIWKTVSLALWLKHARPQHRLACREEVIPM
jgi:asparagine synthase (glutamine-hydrolysing)